MADEPSPRTPGARVIVGADVNGAIVNPPPETPPGPPRVVTPRLRAVVRQAGGDAVVE